MERADFHKIGSFSTKTVIQSGVKVVRVDNVSSLVGVAGANQKAEQTDSVRDSNHVDKAPASKADPTLQQEDLHHVDLPRIVELANKIKKELLDPMEIEFKVHNDSGRTMVVVSDSVTGDVIREIPSKDFLDFVAAMNKFVGLLFDRKV